MRIPVSNLAQIVAATAALILVAAPVAAAKRDYGQLEVTVDRSGKVESCKLLDSSGDKALDTRQLKACESRSFPSVAASVSSEQQSYTVILPVRSTDGKT